MAQQLFGQRSTFLSPVLDVARLVSVLLVSPCALICGFLEQCVWVKMVNMIHDSVILEVMSAFLLRLCIN